MWAVPGVGLRGKAAKMFVSSQDMSIIRAEWQIFQEIHAKAVCRRLVAEPPHAAIKMFRALAARRAVRIQKTKDQRSLQEVGVREIMLL